MEALHKDITEDLEENFTWILDVHFMKTDKWYIHCNDEDYQKIDFKETEHMHKLLSVNEYKEIIKWWREDVKKKIIRIMAKR